MNHRQIRSLCLSLAGVTEDIKWGDHPVFSVAGKMFAILGDTQTQVYSIKADDALYPNLIEQPGIRPAPYLARLRWVQITPGQCSWDQSQIHGLIRSAYDVVRAKLPKKTQRVLAAADSDSGLNRE